MKRSEVCLNTYLDKTFAQDRIIAVVLTILRLEPLTCL